MADNDERDGGELASLRELLASDGWRRFRERIDEEWGDSACVDKLRRALGVLPGGNVETEQQTSTQILAAQREIQRMLEWPKVRLAQLSQPKKRRGLMDDIRRIARP